MDCMQAQQVISTALDREPVDAYQLEEAKHHCRTCPECGMFVRAQLVASQVSLPEPPADLVDRVMSQVRAEAAANEAAAQASAEAAAAAAAQSELVPASPPPPPASLAPKPRTASRLPRMWVSAAAAAAVIVALIGTGTVVLFGMKQMSGTSATKSSVYRSTESAAQAPRIAADVGAAPTGAPAFGGAAAQTTGGQSVTLNGTVYRLVGPAKVDTSTGTVVGTTSTSMGPGNSLASRQVWAGPNADTIYVADDKGDMYAFTRVVRTYAGLTYALTSADLTSFSQWPMLPTQIPQPTATDGGPTFTFDGIDPSGVRVYRLTNSSATQGIAVAPNTSASDPAGGNPNWTWWAILR